MRKKYVLLWTLFLLVQFSLFSQDGTLDPSFGNGTGYVITNFGGAEDMSYALLEQADGKIVAFGFSDYGAEQSLSRYLPDGSLDNSFGTDGKVTNDFNNEGNFIFYATINQQLDGKLLTSATNRLPSGNQDFLLARYLTNGDLDTSFGNNGTVMTDYGEDVISATALLPDGKILAGGWSQIGSSRYLLLTKYLPNGDLDTSFGVDGVVATYLHDSSTIVFPFVIQPNGKVLVAYRGTSGFLTFHKYLDNGALDPTFGTNGVVVANIASGLLYGSIAMKENGTIVAVMRLGNDSVVLAQFLTDGSPDTSFGTNGIISLNIPHDVPVDMLLDQDENILISGNNFGFEVGDYFLTRYTTDGLLDTSFGQGGVTRLGFESHAITLQSDGKILVTGGTYWYSGPVDFIVLRFRSGVLGTSDTEQLNFTIYPNPSQDIFTIKSGAFLDSVSYRISDARGKIIQTGNLQGAETNIDLSGVANGLYFLQVSNTSLKLLKN